MDINGRHIYLEAGQEAPLASTNPNHLKMNLNADARAGPDLKRQ